MIEQILIVTALGVTAAVTVLIARASLMLLILAGSVGTIIGLYRMGVANQSGPYAANVMIVATLIMLLGYLARASRPQAQRAKYAPTGPSSSSEIVSRSGVWAVIVFASGLALYHLGVAGIPLLSSSIETARFDFTSSGLLGVPGRMYLFGVPMAWVLASSAAHAERVPWRSYRPWTVATGVLLFVSIAGGFKSGVVSFASIILVAGTIVAQNRPPLRLIIRRYWVLGILAVSYAAGVATLYPSYASRNQPILGQLIDRLVDVSAEPKFVTLAGLVDPPAGGLQGDFSYFISKYTGGSVVGQYTLERAVSASMIGVDPASSAWTTPVTVGGIPELVLLVGLPGALVLVFSVGVIIGRLYREPTPRFAVQWRNGVMGLFFMLWLARGGLAYYVINFAAVMGILWAVYVLTAAAGWRRDARRRPQESEMRL